MSDPQQALAPRPLAPEVRDPWLGFLRTFTKIGINSFGGPVAQIGVMHEEAVERQKWLTGPEFVHVMNFANLLPGPEALEIAIHLGWLRRGVAGGIAAGLLFVLPGFVSLTLLGWLYATLGHLPAVDGLLAGIRPVAGALLVWAAVRLGDKALRAWPALVLAAAAFVAHGWLGVPFALLLLGCGALGLGIVRLQAATRPLPHRTLWVAALVAAALASGIALQHSPTGKPLQNPAAAVEFQARQPAALGDIAWVNTKAALLTFGGAYTVLPYLREQMVQRHGWVTDGEVADALALGETTPGPLISFGIFLSYLAAGLAGALVGGLCLFLPSFVLVLTLAPHIARVESLSGTRGFLWGVSAGTIGLLLSLGAQVVPDSVQGGFGLTLAAAALVALWRFRLDPIVVVAVGAGLGLLRVGLG